MQAAAIIVAAGRGLRFGEGPLKQLRLLGGRPVVWWSVEAFKHCPLVTDIVVAVPRGALADFAFLAGPKVSLIEGGESRMESTRLGLSALPPEAEIVLVHDAVRPLVSQAGIAKTLEAAQKFGAALLAVPLSDTLKLADIQGFAAKTLDRSNLWRAQTPQAFKREILERALSQSLSGATDESSLAERLGIKAKLVEGTLMNLKITTFDDLSLAEKTRPGAGPGALRIGQGFDFHAFDSSRDLWLGGVLISGEKGLAGFSDADVLAHALVDAIFGALALGDIGTFFPPGDPKWRGASGALLLKVAMAVAKRKGYRLVNADLTLIGERPKISRHRARMLNALSAALGVEKKRLSLKGKTTEGMGFIGRGEGLAASAVVLMRRGD
ncbi:MAG: 2-C-methyl-D-erythritol 4-phosphate cytidylyltransferase [Deltaproteobacteria bacterium]|jgi:2-C-methyl-D-erythritol 4-phosphate cytidylyltransferase/2-C-methyl-D-erythritol 2,4-cyclodiphosphate synthase|nr:2-C-methyl-D-erythritol 4-phosphate cytidylyltransferase [Deltaproteobacteria bacterium]